MRAIFFTLLIANIALGSYFYWFALGSGNVLNGVDDDGLSVNMPEGQRQLVLLSESQSPIPLSTVRVSRPEMLGTPPRSNEPVIADSDSQPAVVDSAPIDSPHIENMCLSVGPFSSLSEANYFVERLAAQGVRSSAKNVLVSTAVGFWLHLPPLTSRKALLRKLEELQRQGIDSYAIPDGELANGISLGMFSEAQRANALKERIAGLGYSPRIAEVPRERRELWVFLQPDEAQKISSQLWENWLSLKEFPKKQQILCSDVASA